MTLAIDVSNYTDALTPEALQGLKDAGIELVIVQAVDPPPGYPVGRTREQIQACLDAGLAVDAYVWLWFDLDIADVERKLALLEGLPIRQLWLDVEDTASIKYNQATCEAKVQAALDACDAWQIARGASVATGLNGEGARPLNTTGVYTGRWFWADPRYMANTTAFADRELWDANYDGVDDAAADFVAYGGWTADQLRIKQFRGTSTLAGVGGLDQNVLSVAEAAELIPQSSDTDPQSLPPDLARETPADWPWPTWHDAAINYQSIAGTLGQQLTAANAKLALIRPLVLHPRSKVDTKIKDIAA